MINYDEIYEEMWVGEWNFKQNMPHREKFYKYIVDSFGKASEGKDQDWILVTVGDYDSVGEFLTEFEEKFGRQS